MSKNSKSNREKKKLAQANKKRKIVAQLEKDKQIIPFIYLDESGNTGSNILDDNQPMFTLAGCKFNQQESERLLALLKSRSPKEAHFKVLKRRKAGQDGIIRLLKHSLINTRNVSVELMHKRFMVVTKIVDVLIEHMLYMNGKDLYKNGANIGLSNLWHMCLPLYCGQDNVDVFYKSFLNMVKIQSDDSIAAFYANVEKLINVCSYDEFKEDLNLILKTKEYVADALNGIDKSILDPSIPTLFSQCITWGRNHPKGFHIVHDDSHAVEQKREMYAQFMDWTQDKIEVGYDRRKFDLPLKGRSLNFGSSTEYPQIQVADIIASSFAYWAAGIDSGETEDYFFLELDKLNLHRLLTPNVIWPTKHVTPKELGTEFDGGLNTANYTAEFLMRAKPNPVVSAI
ncbi:DUF3800 domain-containing protein [Photobacterium phosphoreum]|uniref:DUF3800 domain-containing protein n=1 Tax=Photobacterium phosphoreum TaxID=659 RepID=UPI000D158A45|nr:DUF3800 domain-containing protein [Photobacterium phosphoreum]PTB33386.1 hypothetical protein DAT36_06855 [Photobacterium phosphoreum]